MLRLTADEAARMGIAGAGTPQERRSPGGRSKYRAQPQRAYGRLWASQAELRRYRALLVLGQAGLIRNLEIQPSFPLTSAGVVCARYVADFAYDDAGQRIVEDVKGVRTPLYQLKRKLFQSQYPDLVFREVR